MLGSLTWSTLYVLDGCKGGEAAQPEVKKTEWLQNDAWWGCGQIPSLFTSRFEFVTSRDPLNCKCQTIIIQEQWLVGTLLHMSERKPESQYTLSKNSQKLRMTRLSKRTHRRLSTTSVPLCSLDLHQLARNQGKSDTTPPRQLQCENGKNVVAL